MATIRNTGKQTIYLNTSFRAGGTIQNPFWSLPSSLISNSNDDETLRLTVIDIIMPYQAYNIFQYPNVNEPSRPKTNNNSMTIQGWNWVIGGVPTLTTSFIVSIPIGNYNIYEISSIIAPLIQSNLNTQLGILTVVVGMSYNFNTMKYEISITIPIADGSILGAIIPTIDFPSNDNYQEDITLAEVLAGDLTDINRKLLYTTPAYPAQKIAFQSWGQGNIGMPRGMVIKLDMISSNIGVDGDALGHTTTMATIPINIANGDTLIYQNQNDDFELEIPSHYIDTIQMEVRDENGRPIYTNKDFQFSFRVDYVKLDRSTENLLQELIYLSQLNIMGQKELVESTEPQFNKDNI